MDIPTHARLWLIYPDPTLRLKEALIIMQITFSPRSSEISSGKWISFFFY